MSLLNTFEKEPLQPGWPAYTLENDIDVSYCPQGQCINIQTRCACDYSVRLLDADNKPLSFVTTNAPSCSIDAADVQTDEYQVWVYAMGHCIKQRVYVPQLACN